MYPDTKSILGAGDRADAINDAGLANLFQTFGTERNCPAIVAINGIVIDATYTTLMDPAWAVFDSICRRNDLNKPQIIAGSVVTAGGAGGTVTLDASTLGIGDWQQEVYGLVCRVTIPEGVASGNQTLTITAVNAWAGAVTNAITFKGTGATRGGGAVEVVIVNLFGVAFLGTRGFSPAVLRQDLTGAVGALGTERNITAALGATSPNNVILSVLALTRGLAEVDNLALRASSSAQALRVAVVSKANGAAAKR